MVGSSRLVISLTSSNTWPRKAKDQSILLFHYTSRDGIESFTKKRKRDGIEREIIGMRMVLLMLIIEPLRSPSR